MAFKVGSIYGEAVLGTKKWTGGINKIGAGLKKIGKSVAMFTAAATAAITAFVVKSTVEANKFQKALSNVNTLLDGSQTSVAKMSKSLLMMDSALGNTTELTEGLYQAISAGAEPGAEAINVVKQSAMFAKAALTDTSTAVDVLTTAVNAYGKDVVSTEKASDIFFTTIKQGKINGEQLASTIGQSIPLFASMNIPIEQLTSGLAAMTKQGVNSAQATTQLNAIVNSFLAPSKELTKVLEDLGHESGAAFLETEGLTGALKMLEKATDGSKGKLKGLLGNTRAVRGAMALTGVGGKEFTSILEEMGDVSNATNEAFKKQEKTWETLQNSFSKTQILIGNVSKFFADDLAGGMDDALTSLNNFLLSAEGFDKISKVIVSLAGGFSVIKEVIGILYKAIKTTLITAFENIKTTLADVFGETGKNIDAFAVLSMTIIGVSRAFGFLSKVVGIAMSPIIHTAKAARLAVEATQLTMEGKLIKAAKKSGEAFKEMALGVVAPLTGTVKLGIEAVKAFDGAGEKIGITTKKLKETWIESTSKMRNKVVDNYDKMILGIKDSGNELLNNQQGLMDNMIITVGNGTERMKMTWKDYLDSVALEGRTFGEKFTDNMATAMGTFEKKVKPVLAKIGFVLAEVGKAFNAVFDSVTLSMENELSEIEQEGDKKMSVLETQKEDRILSSEEEYARKEETLALQRENDIISQTEYDLQREALEKQKADNLVAIEKEMDDKIAKQKADNRAKENAQKKKMFDADKANQIANIWINYAVGLVSLWTRSIGELGIIAGPIMAGIMTGVLTGVAVANTVLISQQQFIPEKALGGMATGLTRVNEQGGEIISLPDGSQVIPSDISTQIANNAGSGQTVINNNFKGAIISDKMDLNKITDFINRRLSRQLRLQV